MLSSFKEVLHQLSNLELSLISITLLIMVGARPLLKWSVSERPDSTNVTNSLLFKYILRLNLIALLLTLLNAFLLPMTDHFWLTKLLSAATMVMVAYLVDSLLDVIIHKRFGKRKVMNGEIIYADTYRSRLMSLISTSFLVVVLLIMLVRLIGFESALETGGVIGFFGVFLALTQGAWSPDLISGIIILGTTLLEEGDVVELESGFLGVVFKTKVFHTELLCLRRNNRVMVPNSKIRAQKINNLSRFASARGHRICLSFKIGYDVSIKQVEDLFKTSFIAIEEAQIEVANQYHFELRLLDAGDYAREWGFYCYLKEVKNVLSITDQVRLVIAEQADLQGISLATPLVHATSEVALPSI